MKTISQADYRVIYWRILRDVYFQLKPQRVLSIKQMTFLKENWKQVVDLESMTHISKEVFLVKYKLRIKLIQPSEGLL